LRAKSGHGKSDDIRSLNGTNERGDPLRGSHQCLGVMRNLHIRIQRSAWKGYSANFVLTAFSEVATWQTRLLPHACYHVGVVEPGPGKHPGTMGRENERERMSEASGGGGDARAEMERRIVQRSIEDDAFRQRLIEDPKGALEQELGARLPKELRVMVVEETQDTIYLVLPSTPMAGAEGGDLSDQQLESVAGGGGWIPSDTLADGDCHE
jgi:Nitrile hydratase, alpha chain